MSAAVSNDVTNDRGQEFLSGLWFPVANELDVDDCKVTGELPAGLRGAFVRNGPNPRFEPLGRYHMFDGDGMLHRIQFEDGKASYRNRWIQSRALEVELKLGRPLYYGLSELGNFPDAEVVGDAGPVKNPANTHIIRHAGRYLTLWEGGPPTEVRADLSTVGVHDFDGKLAGGMTAHPRLDPRTGEMFFFAYSVFPPYLRYHAVDAQGNLIHSVEIDVPNPIMMHDFTITEEHAVFLDSPMAFNLSGDGGPMVQWKPENGTRLGVMPRLGQADEIKWYDVENGHVQHFWNAWSEDGRIELSGTRLANPEFGMDEQEAIEATGADAEAGRPTRYWIDLEKDTAGWEQFDDMGGDFCRINEELNGVRTRFHYMSGFYGKADVIGWRKSGSTTKTNSEGESLERTFTGTRNRVP
jgi:carotenoid cleavage dioxygenase-like enzyme